MLDRPLIQSGVSERIWRLKDTDTERFKEEVRQYFALAYPGWIVEKIEYPNVWLKD